MYNSSLQNDGEEKFKLDGEPENFILVNEENAYTSKNNLKTGNTI
jgi:hypothetical protein